MKLRSEVKIGGVVNICKLLDGKEVQAVDKPFNNLILNAFLDRIYTGGIANYAQIASAANGIGSGTRVGSGTTAPAVTDTALETPLLVSNLADAIVTSSVTYDSVNDEYVITRTARTEYAEATSNYNLSEVAIYTDRGATGTGINPIVSRTLIKDGLGNPTTLTLNTGEILVIYYTFTCRLPRTINATRTIKGVSTDLEFKIHYASANDVADFPFIKGTKLGAFGSSLMLTTTDFAMPDAFTVLSTSNWVGAGSVTDITPTNPASGLKQKSRVGLTSAVANNIRGLSFPLNVGTHTRTCLVKATPGFDKTINDVIYFETIVTFTRL